MAQIAWSEIIKYMQTQMTRSAAATSDGGYVVVGDGQDASIPNRGVIVKVITDPGLGIAWEKAYGGKFANLFRGVAELKDGTLVTTGISFYSGISGDENIWVVKMDKDGNKLIDKTFGNQGEQDDGLAVAATSDGGFIVCGLALAKADNIPSIWVLKFASDCTLMWEKKFPGKYAYDIIQTSDGGFMLSGGSPIQASLNSNIYVLKLDAKGNKVWEKTYDQQVYVMLASGITETMDKGFVLACKGFVMKIDKSGAVIYSQNYPECSLNSVVELPDGQLFAGGSALDDFNFDHAYVMAMNASGKRTWDNTSLLPTGWVATVLTNNYFPYVAAGSIPQDSFHDDMFICNFRPTA